MCRMPGQMSPGQSTFERTPSGPPSSASILPSMITAALVTEYSPVACSPQIPGVRRDVDHAAAPPGQVRVGVLRVQQVAAHVDVHHPVVVGQRGVDQPGGDAHAGVVHQHVQAAEMIRRGAHRRRDRLRVRGVRGHEPGARPERLLGLPAEPGIPAGDHHPGALGQETAGHGQAQAGRAAGDQRALSLQQAHGRPV